MTDVRRDVLQHSQLKIAKLNLADGARRTVNSLSESVSLWKQCLFQVSTQTTGVFPPYLQH